VYLCGHALSEFVLLGAQRLTAVVSLVEFVKTGRHLVGYLLHERQHEGEHARD
jgi:hypothetical protein